MLDHFKGHRRTQIIWAAGLLAPQLLAMASTIFRLVHRKRNQGLWWDDFLAFISLVLAFLYFLTTWFNLVEVHTALHVVSGWLFTLSFPTLIWTTRISLALSIARIMPRQHPIFAFVLYLTLFFGAIYLALVIQLTVACGRDTSWTLGPPYVYVPTRSIGIFILCGDLVGDTLLIAIPLRLFWNAKLQPVELFLVKVGFASSILTSTCSIICAVFLLAPPVSSGPYSLIIDTGLAHIMASISLMACNALVIITCLYRYLRRKETEQPNTLIKTSTTQVTEDQYTVYTPTSSNLPSLSTYMSDAVGGRHTFSHD